LKQSGGHSCRNGFSKSLVLKRTQQRTGALNPRGYRQSLQDRSGSLSWKGTHVGLRAAVKCLSHLFTLSEGAGIVSAARIEGPPLYRGASASTETSQLPRFSPSQGARSGGTGPTWVPFPSFSPCVPPTFSLEGGLDGLPLRAAFSPAHPLARRDVPLARARGVRDRALREHRRSSSSIPSSVLRARRAPGCSPPILPLTEIPPSGYDLRYLIRP